VLAALATVALCIGAGACAQTNPLQVGLAPPGKKDMGASTADGTAGELAKATEYWGKEFAKNPRDGKAALSYARNLKAMGAKRQALAVLQQASLFNGKNRELAGEYGRLALEFDQISLAQKLLEHADDPARPDWRVISARGTVLAKQGNYGSAIPYYERALALAPDQPSLLNNLALAHAMEGHPDRAEPLLRRAAAADRADPRVSQNFALVLGLQGKYDEAKLAAARNLPADQASANVDYLRRMVKLEPQPMAPPPPPAASAADASRKRPHLKGSATDDAPPAWTTLVAAAPPAH
jgi:Flp pilus assembly protein TadD